METYTSYRSRTGQTSLTIDFSVKGGPKDVVATLNKDSSISFPDGNLWKKQGGVVGVYSDGFNPERLRIIRAEKGDSLVLDLLGGPNGPLKVSGKIIKPDVAFDFPGKPGDSLCFFSWPWPTSGPRGHG